MICGKEKRIGKDTAAPETICTQDGNGTGKLGVLISSGDHVAITFVLQSCV